MYVLRVMELTWTEYQNSLCIEMGLKLNFVVWLQLDLPVGISRYSVDVPIPNFCLDVPALN